MARGGMMAIIQSRVPRSINTDAAPQIHKKDAQFSQFEKFASYSLCLLLRKIFVKLLI